MKQAESLFAPTAGIVGIADNVAENTPQLDSTGAPAIVGQVRAAHLRVLSKLLQHHLGDSGIAKLVNDHPHLASPLSASLAPLGWVELVELVGALEIARERLPQQLVPRKVGRGVMSATFAHLFGADPSTLSAEFVLGALPTFWDRYHAWGAVEVEVHPGSADVGLDGYAGSPDVCAMISAELERIVELAGASAVGATHTRCVFNGDPRCEYRLSWTT